MEATTDTTAIGAPGEPPPTAPDALPGNITAEARTTRHGDSST
ncbi:hypothetical protein [Nannocystis punicea]|uniref:Uncharacterized protein n=1 Tax=Nannocystis punicea TaxID=2995304 RepID=A0ABY7GXS5_9BACT|nr:hypothetical protein [Nannocystis poenicansa]WAS91783.1 hypothetical protein O0S08_36840 [Nannocystis poenicansa]